MIIDEVSIDTYQNLKDYLKELMPEIEVKSLDLVKKYLKIYKDYLINM